MSDKTIEQLEEEIVLLRYKLSPLEDKEFTAALVAEMAPIDLGQKYAAKYRGKQHIIIRPKELWDEVFELESDSHSITVLGRSLQALGWERSAKNGNLVFCLPLDEYYGK